MKRFIAFMIMLCLTFTSLTTAYAGTIGSNGSVGASGGGGGMAYGPSGTAWGYIIGFSFMPGKAVSFDVSEDDSTLTQQLIDNYRLLANENYIQVDTSRCALVSFSGYTDCGIMDSTDPGNGRHVPLCNKATSSPTNSVSKSKNAYFTATWKWYLSLGESYDERNRELKDKLKKWSYSSIKVRKAISEFGSVNKSQAMDSVTQLLRAGDKVNESMDYFTVFDLYMGDKSAENTFKHKIGMLSAYLTVAEAIGFSKCTDYVDAFLRTASTLEDDPNSKQQSYTCIVVNSVMPFCYSGRWWATLPQFMSWLMGVQLTDFTHFGSKGFGSCDGNVYKMIELIHSHRKCTCHTSKPDMRFCTYSMFGKRMTCNGNTTTLTNKTSGLCRTLMCGNRVRQMVGMGLCTTVLRTRSAATDPPPATSTFKLNEGPKTIDTVKKGIADKETGEMKNHKLYLKNVYLKFGKEDNVKEWNTYLKTKKDTDKVTITFQPYRTGKASNKKQSTKSIKSETASMIKKGVDPMGKDSTLTSISSSTAKVKVTSKFSGATASGNKLTMTVKDFKKVLKAPSKNKVTIKADSITHTFTEKKPYLSYKYALKVTITIGEDKIPANAEETRFAEYWWKHKDKPVEDPEEPHDHYFESTVSIPYSEIKCGDVTDAGANEPFEAMSGFPTTRDIYFASGGDEYLVQIDYEFIEEDIGKRTYTMDTGTTVSSTRIEYQTKPGKQDSADPGTAPEPLKKTCPNCGNEVTCQWFPFRVAETRWNWEATATKGGHTISKDNQCGGATDTKTTSDSATPGPDAVANCGHGSVTKAQTKVEATRWNWEWRNYGHANTYMTSDAESLPYTKCKTYNIGKSTSSSSTQNGKYTNPIGNVSNASESCTMNGSDCQGNLKYKISWDQPITNFNYAKINQCYVWKLVESKVDGMVDLIAAPELTATVQSVAPNELINIAKANTAKEGRFWHSEHTKEQDEYKFNQYTPKSCEACVEWEAGKYLESLSPHTIFNNTYCISDYVVLRTSKGDLSMIYFEYDCKNTTVPVGKVKLSSSKKNGTQTVEVKDVDFKSQNSRATHELVCDTNKMTHYAIKLPDDGITYGGYHGNYESPSTKYDSTSKFTENINISSLKLDDPNYGKYKKSERASKVFKLKAKADVPDTEVRNGEYILGESQVFYQNIVNHPFDGKAEVEAHEPVFDILPQANFGGKVGFTMTSTYSPKHTKVNDVVVHDPVSSLYAIIIPRDKKDDQRTSDALEDDSYGIPDDGKCSGDASTCKFSHMDCKYTGGLYHTAECYDDSVNAVQIGEEAKSPVKYTSSNTIPITKGSKYKIDLIGAKSGDALGGSASGTFTAPEDGYLQIIVEADYVQVNVLKKGGTTYVHGTYDPCSALTVGMTHIHCIDGCRDFVGTCTGVGCPYSSSPKTGDMYTTTPTILAKATAGSSGMKWQHDEGCTYAGEIHTTTSTTECTQCGHSCGGLVSSGPAGPGKGTIYDGFKGTTGTSSSTTNYVTISETIPKYQDVTERSLVCSEEHHAPNTNWRYYVSNWEKSDKTRSLGLTDPEINTASIRPLHSTMSYVKPSDMTSTFVLVKVEGEYKLALKSKPNNDPATGYPWSVDKYTTNGSTYSPCIWNLTNNDAAAYNTKTSKNPNHHYSFGDGTCWTPCNDDRKHKNNPSSVTVGGTSYTPSIGDYLSIDYGFQLYYPNIGDFYGNGAYGIGETSAIEGKGYTTPMDTTEWLRNKYVIFSFDVIYDLDGDGDFSDDKLYLGGEPVPLGKVGSDGRFVDDRPVDYLYNFYIPLEQFEIDNANVRYCAVAINSGDDMWHENPVSHNFERYYNKAAYHDSTKQQTIDLVGRIGDLTMLDTGDFRFANLFKTTRDGWLVDNIVKKVNYSQQNSYLNDFFTVRGESASPSTNGQNTYGTAYYKNDMTKALTFPLTPNKNNIAALQKQPQRVGYLNYMSLDTIGNYYGENEEGTDKYKVQITPFYYHLDLTTGKWTPVDVYMLDGTNYKRIAEFGSSNATTNYEWLYKLNWQEENDRRMYVDKEKEATNSVIDNMKMAVTSTDPNGDLTVDFASILMPSGKGYAYGTANRIFMKDKNRTFIGSTLTEGTYTNPGERITEALYQRNGQRWHFSLGLPSSVVFVPAGQACSQENIKKYSNNHSVVVCAIEVLARGTVWTLKYDGVDLAGQHIQILPDGPDYPYGGNPDGPGDKIIVTVYTPERSSKDDLNVEGTH